MENKKNKTLISNIASIGLVQIVNYIFPLLTIPYVSRVIGPEGLGLFSYISAFVSYFILFVNYGFDLSATRKIASDPENKDLLSKVYSQVFCSRLLLFIICTFFFGLLVFFFPNLKENYLISLLLYINVVAALLTPHYIYQGVQKLSLFSFINVVRGIVNTVCIFLFVSRADHLIYYASIGVLTNLLFALFWFIFTPIYFGIRFYYVSIRQCLKEIWEGKLIFFSTIIFSMYTTANIIILGIYAPPKVIAYYTTAVGLINIIQSVINVPLSYSLYPYIGRAFAISRENGIEKLKRILSILFYFTLFACLSILILSPIMVRLIYGSQFENAIASVRILSFLPLLSSMSSIMGVQAMLNLGMDLKFLKITAWAAVLSVILNLVLSTYYSYIGSSIAYLITEIFIVIGLTISLKREGIILFERSYFNLFNLFSFIKQMKSSLQK